MSSLSVHSAAQNNQLHVVRSLVSENPRLINALDADERTALHWAASSGSVDITRFLIDKKAEVDLVDNSGWTPLHIAGRKIDDICFWLNGPQKNNKGLTPLHYAASKSRIDIGKLLISRGADINAKDKANQVPLHRAATTGSLGFIRLLLDSSVPPNKTRLNNADRIGNTALHLAMDSAHAEAAVALINAGADRGKLNLDGEAPEDVEGVGGSEQRRAKQYVIESCGSRDP
ncbi:ankyrin repeat-containing domain protein [Mycena polygramma]|nr:ankyrin repeat-containing domain protein [Mycena polygramma]